MRADLHLHTSASDGKLSPEEVVLQAHRAGLELIAITDHDSVAGISPALAAARRFPGLRVIPGVELGTDIPYPEVHILGYFIDYTAPALVAGLEEQRRSRVERAQKMLAKLEGMGVRLSWERVQQLSRGESVGRPHIAQAMQEKGYVSTLREAFARYIGRGGPAYVARRKLTPEQSVDLIKQAGRGLAVLAHPAEMEFLAQLLPGLVASGLVGMEVYYNNYPPDMVHSLLRVAEKYHLLPLGGSDYHGLGANDAPIGSVDIPDEVVGRFLELAGNRSAPTQEGRR